jgi:DNA mismatch repair ATPase MutS
VTRLLREAAGCAHVLDAYAAVLQTIEAHVCVSPRLHDVQRRLTAQGVTASIALRQLAALLQWMEVRNAPMIHVPLNALLLWDLHGARRLAAWQRRFRPSIPLWLDAVGEWESLCSLATLAFNGPGWAWPVVRSAGFGLLAEDLGHPLIPDHERVTSDVHLGGRGTIWIVTGPNMAGKSTFLRTVGVNLMLAQTGAPVCARRFELSPLQLITSMRISDSLDKRLSLFYAELQRLKQVLEAVASGEAVFFLIDEMLKGTNTLDRQAGALALVRQLQHDGASGIVATHDLALARLADELRGSLFNQHFDGTVEGERLIFDYRLRAGACERFNALSLMRAIGIRLDEQGEIPLRSHPQGA